jgi:hypothetical protein
MSLAAYQDVFARMVLSPALCLRARTEGQAALIGFDLDDAERARLLHIAGQPGMRITCVLARANRLSSLVGALPLSCELLKPQLGALVDRYWDTHPMADLQSLTAGLAFAQYLAEELQACRIVARFAVDVVRYERAWLELQLSTHTAGSLPAGQAAVRELAFGFDPTRLFEALGAGQPVPDMPKGTPTTVVLDFRNDPPQTLVLRR